MEETLAAAERWLDYLGPSPYLRALAIVVLFLLIAAAAEFLVSAALARMLRRWTGGPETASRCWRAAPCSSPWRSAASRSRR